MVSLDARVIDLDDKLIFDTAGGKSLFWLLPSLAGKRIRIEHDDNACLYSDCSYLYELGFLELNTWELPRPIEFKNVHVKEDYFYDFRMMTNNLGYHLCLEIEDCLSCDLSTENVLLQHGFDEEYEMSWIKINNIKDLYKGFSDKFLNEFANSNRFYYGRLDVEVFNAVIEDNYIDVCHDKDCYCYSCEYIEENYIEEIMRRVKLYEVYKSFSSSIVKWGILK